jgi:hypothetical protein
MIQQTIIIKNRDTVLTIFCQVQVGDAPPTIDAIALAVRNNEELVVDVVVKTCVYYLPLFIPVTCSGQHVT